VRPVRTVKSYGPDIPVLMSSLPDAHASAGDGGKNAGPRGDCEAAVTPSRREGRVISAEPVVPAPCTSFRTGAAGAGRYPVFPIGVKFILESWNHT
jgi:hypothetical protein